MLVIIYSALLSYMTFFTICIAPVINTNLDRKNSSKLLRKVFPRNFLYGLILSFLVLLISFVDKNIISIYFSFVLLLSFTVNLYILIPIINKEADKFKKTKNYSKKFKKLHLVSVLLYLLNMIISSIAIIINY